MKKSWSLGRACLLGWGLTCALGLPAFAASTGADELRASYAQLREQLRNNSFKRPLFIDSTQTSDTLTGDIYAVLDHSFDEVRGALKNPLEWCDILILPFNTKHCQAMEDSGGAALQMRIGRKADQPVQEAYRLDFDWRPVAAGPDYSETRLDAGSGPLGTHDYRIVVSAVPLEAGRTFLHLSYSYGYGLAGRLAMGAYFATAGADKVGFTVTGRDSNGQPIYLGGVRGAIERNVMRYYLAVEAHLDSLGAPPDQQLEKRIETWFDLSERYPRQLHEMDRSTYLEMKRRESRRP